jgi:SAM-dependent methyltransferase
MPTADQRKWDARYRDATGPGAPARVLTDFAHLLPQRGRALDLACGLGANALFLAGQGLDTHAWDVSPIAVGRLKDGAGARGLRVEAAVRDVVAHPPEPDAFDVIVVAHFLERTLAPALAAALRPGGLLFYQTFTRARVDDFGPKDDAYRLAENELLWLFAGPPEDPREPADGAPSHASHSERSPGPARGRPLPVTTATTDPTPSGRPLPRYPLQVLAYREEGRVGDLAQGLRNEAMLVARRT